MTPRASAVEAAKRCSCKPCQPRLALAIERAIREAEREARELAWEMARATLEARDSWAYQRAALLERLRQWEEIYSPEGEDVRPQTPRL